jgi:prolyl oligopeptidase
MALLIAADFTPPPTKADPVTETLHGVAITDPYRWLENQDSPETRVWLAEQDKFARRYLDAIPGREQIRKSLESLEKIDSMGAPIARNGRYFFSRRLAAEDRRSLLMRRGYRDNDEILVDPGKVASDPTSSVNYWDVTPDGGMVAFGIRRGGEDESEIRLMDVATRRELPDALPRGRYFGFSIKPDKSGYYYSRFVTGQGARVYYHAMGTKLETDKEIFGSGYGPEFFVGVGLDETGRWLLIQVGKGVPSAHSELYLQDLKGGAMQNILKADNADFDAAIAGDALILSTNWNAPNRHIFRVDMNHPARDRWKEIVSEGQQAITGVSAAGGRLFVSYLENVITRIKQFDIDGKYLGDLKLPGIGTAYVPSGRWEDDQAFFTFTSYVEPAATWRVMVSTGKQDLWFRPKVPIHAENIETKQVWYNSKDGTRVPMFLVHQKGIPLDGNRPVLLTGYGGFNYPSLPGFSPLAAWWTEQGGVFAEANLRGGGEFGESWHKAGMFEKKQNVFDDFIAAGEWLIGNKYTNTSKLGIMGGSNGGLLMGAMMTQRPDLFGAIICGAPLLDMLRYHKLSVGAWWVSEYGSADDAKQFPYIYKYSPYHNVRRTKYPAILFSTGDADTRVDPSHARKMTALVQASNTADTPVILRYDTKGGHSGIGSVNKTIEEQVDWMSFLCDRLGVKVQ